MPIFHEKAGDKGTFGGTMGVAMAKHNADKKPAEGAEKEKDAKSEEHLNKAKEHIDAALNKHKAEEEEEGGESAGSLLGALGMAGDEQE